jgi:enolase-phosphatase E1
MNTTKPEIKAILTDIEGTTTSIGFVHEVLFPYSSRELEGFIKNRADEPYVNQIIWQVLNYGPDANLSEPSACQGPMAKLKESQIIKATEILRHWIKLDLKIKPLKDLQGLIWRTGYETGAYQGHIYEDAYLKLLSWHQAGIPIYIYSSGSITAQKLLFGFTPHGDLNYLFTGNFDTNIGGKKEKESYRKIVNKINLPAENILFLSDISAELDAAKYTGLQTAHLVRDAQPNQQASHLQVKDFFELNTRFPTL